MGLLLGVAVVAESAQEQFGTIVFKEELVKKTQMLYTSVIIIIVVIGSNATGVASLPGGNLLNLACPSACNSLLNNYMNN